MHRRVVSLAAAALLLAACPDDESTGESSGQPSGSTSTTSTSSAGGSVGPECGDLGEGFSLDDACQECGVTSCCDELKACDDDPACVARFECRFACPDVACEDQCDSEHPGGAAASDALEACLGACSCPEPTAICDTGVSAGAGAECDTCLSTACCTEVQDCVADTNCRACFDGAGSACDTDTLFGAVRTCFMTCADPCDG